MFPFYRFNAIIRLSANRTVLTHLPFFVILTLKTLFWSSLLEKREPYRDAFLFEKSLKIDIYAERFALLALFSCKKWNFYQHGSRFLQKRSDCHSGTVRTNAFFRIDLF